MKKHYSTRFFLSQAFTSLWRNGVMSAASVAVLMSCLVVLGCFAMLVININVNLENVAKLNEIMVFCDRELEEDAVKEVERQIKQCDYVDTCKRITKEESLEKLKAESPDHAEVYDDFSGENNPLCESFEVIYKGSDETKIFDLESRLRNIEGVSKINSVYQTARTIDKLKSGILLVFTWFLVILFVVSVFVIINTIKAAVYARKLEIQVMRYVGATNNFIITPFVFEGVIIGAVASVLGFLIETYVYNYIESTAFADLQVIQILDYSKVALPMAAGFLVVGIVTGIIGSVVSLSKYLKS